MELLLHPLAHPNRVAPNILILVFPVFLIFCCSISFCHRVMWGGGGGSKGGYVCRIEKAVYDSFLTHHDHMKKLNHYPLHYVQKWATFAMMKGPRRV